MRISWVLILCGLISGCSGIAILEGAAGERVVHLQSQFFEHKVLVKPQQILEPDKQVLSSEVIVVVVEGDGMPWKESGVLALDPTPSDPLMLDWYRQWTGSAIYLGRPCYYGAKELQPPKPQVEIHTVYRLSSCNPYWFSMGRYSQPVVQSMVEVLSEILPAETRVVILGHSGGGALAMLMAAKLDQVVAVVTLAANLDVQKWVEFHDYTPLYGSLDPARENVLPPRIRQLHMASAADDVILPAWIKAEARRQEGEYVEWQTSANRTEVGDVQGAHGLWRDKWAAINMEILRLTSK